MKKIKISVALFALIIGLVSCVKKNQQIDKITANITPIDSIQQSDSSIVRVINPYRKKMINEINTVISYAPNNLVRTDGNMQSSLGNLLADLCFAKGDSIYYTRTGKHADFAFFNYGGIRAGINKGNVTNKHVFELMPFDNTLVVVEMTAKKIEELIQYFKANKRAHPISKQVNVVLTKNGYSIKINGRKLDSSRTYKVVSSNYLQSGGDRMYFFLKPVHLFESNFLIRDAIKSHFKNQDTLKSRLDNRVFVK